MKSGLRLSGRLTFAYLQTGGYFNVFSKKSQWKIFAGSNTLTAGGFDYAHRRLLRLPEALCYHPPFICSTLTYFLSYRIKIFAFWHYK